MTNYRNYSIDDIKRAAKVSGSIREVLRRLGLSPGGNYTTIRKRIVENNIDISHFHGMGWNKGKIYPPYCKSIPLEELLVLGKEYPSHTLKLRLLEKGIFNRQCSVCLLTTWNELPIPIELDHISGNRLDNRLENLRIICPNCHAQTSTYKGKNKAVYARNFEKESTEQATRDVSKPHIIKYCKYCNSSTDVSRDSCSKCKKELPTCVDCLKVISKKSTRCKSCTGKWHDTKIIWPTTQELLTFIETGGSYCALARKLGVSDNAIRKRIKRHPV